MPGSNAKACESSHYLGKAYQGSHLNRCTLEGIGIDNMPVLAYCQLMRECGPKKHEQERISKTWI
jgi:hypothetical protein